MMREGPTVSNKTLRGWGMRRYAVHHLADELPQSHPTLDLPQTHEPDQVTPALQKDLLDVLTLVASQQVDTTRAIQDEPAWSYRRALTRVNRLIMAGLIEATASPTSRNRRYGATPSGLRALSTARGTDGHRSRRASGRSLLPS